MTELESAIWEIVTRTTKTIGDQKQQVIDIVALLLPLNITRYALSGILDQLRLSEYTNEAGPLALNTAFVALEELSRL